MQNIIDLEILHIALYVCKNYNRRNKIAHVSISVQKQNCTQDKQCAKIWRFYEFCKQHITNDERNDVFKGRNDENCKVYIAN